MQTPMPMPTTPVVNPSVPTTQLSLSKKQQALTPELLSPDVQGLLSSLTYESQIPLTLQAMVKTSEEVTAVGLSQLTSLLTTLQKREKRFEEKVQSCTLENLKAAVKRPAARGKKPTAPASDSKEAQPKTRTRASTKKASEASKAAQGIAFPVAPSSKDAEEMIKEKPILCALARFLCEVGPVDTLVYSPLVLPFCSPEESKEGTDAKEKKDTIPAVHCFGLHVRNFLFGLNETIKNKWKDEETETEDERPTLADPVKIASFRSILKPFTIDVPLDYQEECLKRFPYENSSKPKAKPSKGTKEAKEAKEVKVAPKRKKPLANADVFLFTEEFMLALTKAFKNLYPKSTTDLETEDDKGNITSQLPFSFQGRNKKFIKRVGIKTAAESAWTKESCAKGYVPIYGIPASQEFFQDKFMAWRQYINSPLFKLWNPSEDKSSTSFSSSSSSTSSTTTFPFHIRYREIHREEPESFASIMNEKFKIPKDVMRNKALWSSLFTVKNVESFWGSQYNKFHNNTEKILLALRQKIEKDNEKNDEEEEVKPRRHRKKKPNLVVEKKDDETESEEKEDKTEETDEKVDEEEVKEEVAEKKRKSPRKSSSKSENGKKKRKRKNNSSSSPSKTKRRKKAAASSPPASPPISPPEAAVAEETEPATEEQKPSEEGETQVEEANHQDTSVEDIYNPPSDEGESGEKAIEYDYDMSDEDEQQMTS